MSQEEEKLIEEFKNELETGENLLDEIIFNSATHETKEKIIREIDEIILKAYRFGKLAGFEMCEKKYLKPFIQPFYDNLETSHTAGLITLGKAAQQIISLIEEEKKKL